MKNEFWYTALAVVFAAVTWRWVARRWHVHIVRESEAALLFRFGKLIRELEPGRHRLFGRGYDVARYETRWRELVVQGQELLTRDRASVRLTVVTVYRVVDASVFHLAAENPVGILYTAIQLAVRDLAGELDLEALLQRKDNLGDALRERLHGVAADLGLEVRESALRDVLLSGELKRALSGVIQSRAEALAGLEKARGQAAATRSLANTARLFEKHEGLLQMRYLQVLEESAAQPGATVILGDGKDWLLPSVRPPSRQA